MFRNVFVALCLSTSVLAQPAPPQPRPRGHMPSLSPEDEAAIKNYDLSAAKIDKLMNVGVKMREYVKAHPEVQQQNLMEGKTLDSAIQKMEGKPELVAMMKSEGVTPRDWLLGVMAFTNAAMWSEMSKRYPNQPAPPMVNQKNVELLQKHPELMEKWKNTWEPAGHGQPGAQ